MQGFIDLFEGRSDAYGLLHGECVRGQVVSGHFADHLTMAERSLGIYPMVEADPFFRDEWKSNHHGLDGGNFYVKWGCSDIDLAEDQELALTLAVNLRAGLEALSIQGWIERTKGKGFHVWVFADEWVPAVVMRRAFLVAHQIAGVAPTEVNPKSLHGGKTGLGNYVNLPYPHGWEETARRCVLDPTTGWSRAYCLDDFLDLACQYRTSFDTLLNAAKLWKEPERKGVKVMTEPSAEAAELARCLSGLAYKVWSEGPLPGRDRSGAMARFCHLCADGGIAAGTCMVLLRDMDDRLGKFIDRDDREDQLVRLVENAYG